MHVQTIWSIGYRWPAVSPNSFYPVTDITDEEKLNDFIGNIQEVKVKYPYYLDDKKSRKHISIVIVTDKGNYSFDIRNASRGFLPNQINLVRAGSAKDTQLHKANIAKLGNTELEDLLWILLNSTIN